MTYSLLQFVDLVLLCLTCGVDSTDIIFIYMLAILQINYPSTKQCCVVENFQMVQNFIVTYLVICYI